jgi:hypothetical protein
MKRHKCKKFITQVLLAVSCTMMCTRPDISFSVGMVSRNQANLGQSHWKAVKIILRYLKGTIDYSLYFQGENLQLMGYTDADWGGDLDERKSTSSYVFLLNVILNIFFDLSICKTILNFIICLV